MLEFIYFHDFLNIILVFIIRVVLYIITSICYNKITNIYLIENQKLESIWILIPSLILLKIGVPSLYLLYITDDSVNTSVTLKVNAHQWYWGYEYSDFWSKKLDSSMEFDSYIIPEKEIELGITRLLDTDMRPVLPYLIQTRILITRIDVLHSWTVPRLGVKADANPGRLNQVKFYSYQPGIYYGQCSEICGANHRFMPISLEFFKADRFLDWVILNRHD